METDTYRSGAALPYAMYRHAVSKRVSTNQFYFTGGALTAYINGVPDETMYKEVHLYNPVAELRNKMLIGRSHHSSHIYEL